MNQLFVSCGAKILATNQPLFEYVDHLPTGMKSVDLTVTLPDSLDILISDQVGEAIRREEMISWDIDQHTDTVQSVSVIVGDRRVVERAVSDLDHISRLETTPIDGDTFYAYAEGDLSAVDGSFVELFEQMDAVIVPPMVYTGDDTFSMTVIGSEDDLRRLVSDIPNTFAVDVNRYSEHRQRTEPMVGGLTARQFAALEIAAELGYFAVPREAPLTEVAAALDCTESTASTVVRTAVQNLVDSALVE